jgi:hypothetical protein
VRFFDPETITQVRRGKLPHWTQPDVTYFVTFRLADSLPATKLLALREERDLWLRNHPVPLSDADRQEYHRRFNGKFEYWLDQGYGECRLARPDLKSIVETALMYFHGERYRLGESIVMPNHVHVLVTRSNPGLWPRFCGVGSRTLRGKSTRYQTEAGIFGIAKALIISCGVQASSRSSNTTFETTRNGGKQRRQRLEPSLTAREEEQERQRLEPSLTRGGRGEAKAGAFAYAGGAGKAKAGAFAYDGKKWLYEPSEWGYQRKDINDN